MWKSETRRDDALLDKLFHALQERLSRKSERPVSQQAFI